jgi:hypothetical protein
MYFSLDLSRAPTARVKVYARHRSCSVDDLERAAVGSSSNEPGDVRRFLRTLVPEANVPFEGRAPFTCYAFVGGAAAPATATTHFPINGYAPDDGVIRDRVAAYLGQVGLAPQTYLKALAAHANRPLERGVGLQSYASIRRHDGSPRMTVYLPVEVYTPGTVAAAPVPLGPCDASELRREVARIAIPNHPLLRRLRREAPDADGLRALAAAYALYAGNVRDSVRHSMRGADDGVRRLVVGRFRSAQWAALPVDPALSATPGAAPSLDVRMTGPSRNLIASLGRLAEAVDPYEAIGAWMAADVAHAQVSEWLQQEAPRLKGHVDVRPWESAEVPVNPEAPTSWVALVAGGVGSDHSEASRRGARRMVGALWAFLDEVYEALFCAPAP